MKKDTPKNKTVTKQTVTKPATSQQDQQIALQLFEKGLLSGKTTLEKLGFDPKQEIDRKKTDSVKSPYGTGEVQSDPEWHKLQKENMRLSNREMEARVNAKKCEVTANRIEHARRNVEVIGRIVAPVNSLNWDDSLSMMEDVLKANLEILKEAKKIK